MLYQPLKNLLVATPCYGGMVSQIYMQSVLALTVEAHRIGLPLGLALLGQDALITRSRNTLTARFLESAATHLLFIDADIGFTPDDALSLLARDEDVIGALYPLRGHVWDDSTRRFISRGEPLATAPLRYVGDVIGPPNERGLQRARYAGTGFLMISRMAIERMVSAYPETRCMHSHVAGEPAREVHALFDCVIDPETRDYLSEDFAFCARWRALGGEIWLDPSIRLVHAGMSEFVGSPALRAARANA